MLYTYTYHFLNIDLIIHIYLMYLLVRQVNLCGCFFMGLVCTVLLVEDAPLLYHAYAAMTVFLWTQIFSQYQFLKALWRYLHGSESYHIIKLIATSTVSVFILEFLVGFP